MCVGDACCRAQSIPHPQGYCLLPGWEGEKVQGEQLDLKRCGSPSAGQTYQCQDAVSMFLEGTGLIVRILPKQMAEIKDPAP